eukprot:1140834-Pelagomonas_calceolata.AAC.2
MALRGSPPILWTLPLPCFPPNLPTPPAAAAQASASSSCSPRAPAVVAAAAAADFAPAPHSPAAPSLDAAGHQPQHLLLFPALLLAAEPGLHCPCHS